MAKKISDLTPATQLGDNDSFVFNDVVAGNDKRVTAGNLLDAIDGASITYVDDKASVSFGAKKPFTSFLSENLSVNIPSDFATLQDAIDTLSGFKTGQGVIITLNIESGHEISGGIDVRDTDLRNFIIESADPVVSVSATFTGALLNGERAFLPRLNTVFNMNNLGTTGISLFRDAHIYCEENAGVINAGQDGIFVNRRSTMYAHKCDFSGAGRYGAFVDHVGIVYARFSDFSEASDIGVLTRDGSVVEIRSGKINNCGKSGIAANTGSVIDASDDALGDPTEVINCGSLGVGAEQDAVRAINGGRVIIENGIITGAERDAVSAQQGASICAAAANISNAGRNGAAITRNSFFEFQTGVATGCGNHGILCIGASVANCQDTDIKNSGNNAVRCEDASTVNARNCDGDNAFSNSFQVSRGGIINAHGATGSLSITANTITADGIIFN